jgi:hypothetical protein
MKQFHFMVFSAILLSGCSADMVVRPGGGSASQYAPVNESSRPGIVKYLNEGAQSVKEARRQDAYKQMHNACGGDYKIVAEGPRAEGSAIVPAGYGAITADSQYLYIQFECVSPK